VLPRNRFLLPAISALLAIALVAVLVLGASKGGGSHVGHPATFDGAAIPGEVRAPDFTLTDHSGRSVSVGAFRAGVTMLVFLPAGAPSTLDADCRVCVLAAQQVRGALDELGSKTRVRTIFLSGAVPGGSADRLLSGSSLANRAQYLTGGAIEVGKVWRAYRIDLPSSNRAKAEAAVTVVLIDRRDFERVAFGVEQLTPEGLSHDIRLLEAA
jgi:protein SCO1/2